MATLPQRIVGEAGHVGDHNALHTRFNESGLDLPADGYPSTSTGPLAEFYNMMMTHFDGTRATGFYVNVQHPDFGAVGIQNAQTDDAPALNAAVAFATDTGHRPGPAVWLPPRNSMSNSSFYHVDTPFKVYAGVNILGYGARVGPSPRFDFLNYYPVSAHASWSAKQAVVEGYNENGRLGMDRYDMEGLLIIDDNEMAEGVGANFHRQQPGIIRRVRIENFRKCQLITSGQQAHWEDLMLVGPNYPGFTGPVVGLRLGQDLEDVTAAEKATASMMWFNWLCTHGCTTHVHQKYATAWKNSIHNWHIEPSGRGTIVTDPVDMILLEEGGLYANDISATMARYSTILHVPNTDHGDWTTYRLTEVFGNSGTPTNQSTTLLLNDEAHGHVMKMWGDTRLNGLAENGAVRYVKDLISAGGADTGTWPRINDIYMVSDEGGFTAFGSYNSRTPDASQRPLFRMRPGATQMGHLASWYDKAGVERYLITADGMPKLPGYTAATKPTAVGRGAIMIYDLDTNKVQVSDGATWVSLH